MPRAAFSLKFGTNLACLARSRLRFSPSAFSTPPPACPITSRPALLAGLVAGLVIAVWGAETTQVWWISLNGLDAIALALMCKGLPRATRPPVTLAEPGSYAPEADADFEDRNFAD